MEQESARGLRSTRVQALPMLHGCTTYMYYIFHKTIVINSTSGRTPMDPMGHGIFYLRVRVPSCGHGFSVVELYMAYDFGPGLSEHATEGKRT